MTTLPKPLFVAIVDDSPVVFLGVSALLRPFRHRVRVEEYVGALPHRGRVDIVLYDPFVTSNKLGRLREIATQTGAPVMVFCSEMGSAQDEDAMGAGAAAVLSWRVDGASIVTAFEAVVAGATVPTRPTRPTVHREPPMPSPMWLGEQDGLSAREGAIVALIVLGLSNQEIADALHLSPHSIKTHIRSAYRQMGVASRTKAISWGVDHGLQLTAPAARLNHWGQQ